MTNTKVLSVFAIVAVAAMMGASTIAPAYAAQKFIDFKEQSETPAGFAVNLCGEVVVELTISTNTFLKVWDNQKFKFHDDAQINLYSLGGALVGTAPLQSLNIQGDLDDFPISGNFNQGGDGECLDGTTFTAFPADHCGATLQKDGELIEHSVSCF